MLYYKFCKIFRNKYFEEHLRTAVSYSYEKQPFIGALLKDFLVNICKTHKKTSAAEFTYIFVVAAL